MGKNKLKKFADMDAYPHVFQLSFNELREGAQFKMKGRWNELFFKNENPIVLELGCGRGEYTIGLAKDYPNKNFIGIDIKGSRMWTGATESLNCGMKNVAFLRTKIEMIAHFFDTDEVSEIWITFPDPQMKKVTKRMTATNFMEEYRKFLRKDGYINLKTDSNFMYTYTLELLKINELNICENTNNLYASEIQDKNLLNIKTYYEQQWLARGLTIKYLKFQQRQDEQPYIEPDIEIEYDTYRSYARNKRSELNFGK